MPRAASTTPLTKKRLSTLARGVNTSSKSGAALVDVDKPLTEMQRMFVKNWATGESILSASFRAGFTDRGTQAYRLAKMPNVIRLYDEEKMAYEKSADMSRKKVMDMLIKSFEHAELAGEPASMVAAAREIGRMCGYFEPIKHQVSVNVQGNVVHQRLNKMTDSELLELITAKAS